MSDNKDKKTILDACLGSSGKLADLIEYAESSIVSKTILDKPVGSITLFAFDKGQKLSEHTSPYDAVVYVVDGSASLVIGGEELAVPAGEMIIMPANIPHEVGSQERFKMLLTMIRT